MADKEIVLVSACLVGINCRYDGTSKRDVRALDYLKNKIMIPVCPELLAGLGIPRSSAEIDAGDGYDVLSGKARVLLKDGRDFTREFINGSREALKIASLSQATTALLKDNSPCCGVNYIYSKGRLIRGVGVFTALLIKNGFAVASEKELAQ
jgi:uncharacterized protein YbbK (DUF523 family)